MRRAAIYALVLAPLIALHARYVPGRGPFSLDGSYYLQGARYVMEQNRLMTGLSLYHEGLAVLPSPWNTAPLWPLVLGLVAKATGLVAAANLLPQLFYVLDLVFLALLAARMSRRLGGPIEWRIGPDALDVSHLVIVLGGLNFIFFESTVYPYTEGLAFALGTVSLLVLDSAEERQAGAFAMPLLAGVLGGLSCLARYQMVALPLAAALLFFCLRRWKAFALYCAATTVVVLPWMVYAHSLLRLRAGIEPWDEWIHMPTAAGTIWQLVRGVAVAFDPFSPASYFRAFGVLLLLLPLPFFTRGRLPLLPAVTAATGILGTVMLAHYESTRLERWLFGERHSLLFLYTLLAALVWAVTRGGRTVRTLAIGLALLGSVQGGVAIATTPPPMGNGLSAGDRALVAWLTRRDPHAVVLTTNAHILSVYTHNPMQWTDCGVSPERTRIMLDKLHVGYVVIYRSERGCAFVRGLDDVLTPVASFADSVTPVSLFEVRKR